MAVTTSANNTPMRVLQMKTLRKTPAATAALCALKSVALNVKTVLYLHKCDKNAMGQELYEHDKRHGVVQNTLAVHHAVAAAHVRAKRL